MAEYRMQALLEIRGRAKEAAEQAFAEALRAVAAAKQRQREMEEELARRKAERRARVEAYLSEIMAKGTGAGALVQMGRFEQRLKDEELALSLEIDAQKERVREAEAAADQKRAEMAEAARELKAIEKHREAWAKQVKAERDKREELVQEEIGSALHLARQRKD